MFEINKQRMVILERKEPNKMCTMIAPCYCLERISKLQCRDQEPIQNPEHFLSWGDGAKSRKNKVLGYVEQSTREVTTE